MKLEDMNAQQLQDLAQKAAALAVEKKEQGKRPFSFFLCPREKT